MAGKLPELVGLADLLQLSKPLGGRTPMLVFFNDREFKKLLKNATPLKSRPKAPAMAFSPVAGGMVMGGCESPTGQICFGQWTPADGSNGVYFGCRCKIPPEPPQPKETCRILLNTSGTLECVGKCEKTGQRCTLRSFFDPKTGRFFVECACQLPILKPRIQA